MATPPPQVAPRDVTQLLRPILQRHKLPSLVGAVVVAQALPNPSGTSAPSSFSFRIASIGGEGVRERGKGDPISIVAGEEHEDQFHLGSCTKAMTATLAAILVEQGLLNWHTTLEDEFLKSDEPPAKMHEGWKKVTVSQLLTNRGGAPGSLDSGGLWSHLWSLAQQRSSRFPDLRNHRHELVKGVVLSGKPPYVSSAAAASGQRHPPYEYSNAGFSIAGAMLERRASRASGRDCSWEQLVQQLLFQPLGMTKAGFGAPGDPSSTTKNRNNKQPLGHRDRNCKGVAAGVHADNPQAIAPAGAVHAPISQWARFIAMHLAGYQAYQGVSISSTALSSSASESPSGMPARLPLLLGPASFKMLHAAPYRDSDRYAMGWIVGQRPWAKGKRVRGVEGGHGEPVGLVLTHSGSNTMWYCSVWLAPERGFAVLAASNQGDAQAAVDEAVSALVQDHLAHHPTETCQPLGNSSRGGGGGGGSSSSSSCINQ